MGYRALAEAVMLAHFAFLAFLPLGGFLARRRRWVIVPHVCAVLWAVASVAVGMECPLTTAEDRLRRLGGEPGLPHGFIDTYLAALVSSDARRLAVQTLVALLVAASWLWCCAPVRSRGPRAGRAPGRPPRSASP